MFGNRLDLSNKTYWNITKTKKDLTFSKKHDILYIESFKQPIQKYFKK